MIVLSVAGTSCATSRRAGGAAGGAGKLESHLRAAEAAWRVAIAPTAGPAAYAAYGKALEPVLEDLQRRRTGIPCSEPVSAGAYTLAFEPGTKNSPFREIYNLSKAIPAHTVAIKHARQRIATPGFGLAVVMVRDPDARAVKTSPFVPLNGRWLPATFAIDFTQPGRPLAQFYNTRFSQSARVNGRTVALATDFSAGLELSLGSGFLHRFALAGLLKPESELQRAGLYITETFNPDRVPVIMVHGLASAPHIWENVMNEIFADPVLRDRYQLWYYLYPTGLPVASSAESLRGAIDRALDAVDPDRRQPALRHCVVIGHSMGGLLSRLQVIDSGDDLWKSMFTVPPEELPVGPATRERLRHALVFDHQPEIERVIFIATPHRGSEIADWRVVRWAVKLIRLPISVVSLAADIARLDPSVFNHSLRSFDAFGTRSVDNLSPRHPLLSGMARRPILVPYHSIIGNRGRTSPLEKSSDGVVPYWSAHLDGAQSEKIVPAPHSCVECPATAAEVTRILHEHLNGIGGTKPSRRAPGARRKFTSAT